MIRKCKNSKLRIMLMLTMLMMILGLSTPIISSAQTIARRNNIQSSGKLEFEQGKVLIDSADLRYLADEVDSLEITYKATTIEALNAIGTYFCNDGNITNDLASNEVDTEEEKTSLSFGSIKNGILLSQSVDSLSTTQAINKEGNGLFYISEEAFHNRNLLQTTTNDTGYPMHFQPITADNLTAGTAAWVNGQLIRGNGADNASSYAQGFVDGQANAIDNLDITYTYHYHEGDATNGGGCYEKVTSSRVCGAIYLKREYYRGYTCHAACNSYYEKEYACRGCGNVTGWQCAGGGNSCGSMGGQVGGNHIITSTGWQPTCGYSQGQILTATIVY